MKKTALVTGASGGLGAEFAQLLAKDGYDLVLVARNKERLEQVARSLEHEYKIFVIIIIKDLSAVSAAEEIYQQLAEKKVIIDVLINNAGFATYGPFVENDSEKEKEEIVTNVVTLTMLTKLLIKNINDHFFSRPIV